MKSCCWCGSEFDLYEHEGKCYCLDCLLGELGISEEKKVYYINYETMKCFDDIEEVKDYLLSAKSV